MYIHAPEYSRACLRRYLFEFTPFATLLPSFDVETRLADGELLAERQAWLTACAIAVGWFVFLEVLELAQSGLFTYFSNGWNVLDWLNFTLFLLCYLTVQRETRLAERDATAAGCISQLCMQVSARWHSIVGTRAPTPSVRRRRLSTPSHAAPSSPRATALSHTFSHLLTPPHPLLELLHLLTPSHTFSRRPFLSSSYCMFSPPSSLCAQLGVIDPYEVFAAATASKYFLSICVCLQLLKVIKFTNVCPQPRRPLCQICPLRQTLSSSAPSNLPTLSSLASLRYLLPPLRPSRAPLRITVAIHVHR